MKFAEITSRLTGLSIPIFGVSWSPPEPQVTVARRVITFLEDRRVLYDPYRLEVPHNCVDSILKIREYLTKELQGLASSTELTASLRAMRAACRKFLASVTIKENKIRDLLWDMDNISSWKFFSALGELRGVFGIHIARIAAHHGLNIEDELASILPITDAQK